MPRAMSAEVVFLGIATLYSLTLPLRHTLTLVDAAVLVAIFCAYAWRLSKAPGPGAGPAGHVAVGRRAGEDPARGSTSA